MVKTNNKIRYSWIGFTIGLTCAFSTLLLLLGYGYYWYQYTTAIAKTTHHIEHIALKRSYDIEIFFQHYIKILHAIAKKDVTARALVAPDDHIQLFSDVLASYEDTLNYKDIFLIQSNGSIVYTIKNKDLLNQRVYEEPLKHSIIADSFQRSIMSLTPDISPFTVDTYFNEPALVICIPILQDNHVVGALMMQMDPAHFYTVVRNYQELGNSGEITLGRGIEQGTLLIAPTRHVSNTAFKLQERADDRNPTLLYRATRGEQGSGIYRTKERVSYIAAWRYIPQTGWGLVVTISISEILGHLSFLYEGLLWLILIVLCLTTVFVIYMRTTLLQISHLKELFHILYQSRTTRISLSILWAFLIMGLIAIVYRYYTLPYRTIQDVKRDLTVSMSKTKENIAQYQYRIAQVGSAIADDLNNGRLKKEDLFIRMNRDLEENPSLFGIIIAYEPQQFDAAHNLYAPFVTRTDHSRKIYQLENIYNYTQPDQSGYQTKWYRNALKKGPVWIDPYVDMLTRKRLGFFAVPFYDNSGNQHKPIGVVAIAYELHDLRALVSTLNIGQTGYAFILSDKGLFIEHPLESYIDQGKTIFDISQQTANDILQKMGQHAALNRPFRGSYFDPKTSQKLHARLEPITSTRWSLGVLFVEQEVSISPKILFRYQLWILLLIVLISLVTIALFVRIENNNPRAYKNFAFFMTIMLMVAQIVTWYRIAQSNPDETAGEIKIVDSIGLDKFFDNTTNKAVSKNEPKPIAIPTGIFINAIRLPELNRAAIQAYVWQRYDASIPKKTARDIQLPGASIDKEIIYQSKDADAQIIGWKVHAMITQKTNFTFFPFDDIRIKIPIASTDIIDNVLLMPDLSGYQYINPKLVPGVSPELYVPGFNAVQSFFAFEKIRPQTNFGLKEYTAVSDRFQLNYILILSRNLINAFVVYLVPLLIILFSLFALFLFTNQQNVLPIVTSYTGLLFALVLLHQTLRNSYPAERILYIEYFFFFVYISILLMVLHSLFLKMYSNSQFFWYFTATLRIFFWPLQLLSWFITTIIVFY